MPSRRPTLSVGECRAIAREAFEGGDDLIGIECEWFVHPSDHVSRPAYDQMAGIASISMAHGSVVSIEPGGQVELSTMPFRNVSACLSALREDERQLKGTLLEEGLSWNDSAIDTTRRPVRILPHDRYRAMEEYWHSGGVAGVWMMNNTASVQMNISNDRFDPELRWRTVNAIGPALIALFANSGGVDAAGRRWESLRQGIWASMPQCRTSPVRLDLPADAAWLEYALSADVFLIRRTVTDGVAVGSGFTFDQWLRYGHQLGWPTSDDFRYHLSTLFPPVRPKGWLELRMLDALPDPWRGAAALTVAAATTAPACRELLATMPHTDNLWRAAARRGLRDVRMRAAADRLVDVVLRHVDLVDARPSDVEALREFVARYVNRGMSPSMESNHRLAIELIPESFVEVETGQTLPWSLRTARAAVAVAVAVAV